MEIRPEVSAIISNIPERASAFFIGPPERVAELIEALSDYDVKGWDPYPVSAIATGLIYAASRPESPDGEVSQAFLNYLTDTAPEALLDSWRAPLLEAIEDAGENHFAAAQQDFDVQDIASGATNLFRAVNCAIIGQAAIRGWPHADVDINTIIGLASGQLPTSVSEFNEIIDAMPDHQLDLNSAYGATAAVLDAAPQLLRIVIDTDVTLEFAGHDSYRDAARRVEETSTEPFDALDYNAGPPSTGTASACGATGSGGNLIVRDARVSVNLILSLPARGVVQVEILVLQARRTQIIPGLRYVGFLEPSETEGIGLAKKPQQRQRADAFVGLTPARIKTLPSGNWGSPGHGLLTGNLPNLRRGRRPPAKRRTPSLGSNLSHHRTVW